MNRYATKEEAIAAGAERRRNLADDAAAAKRKARVEALARDLYVARTTGKMYGMTTAEAEQCFESAEAFIKYAESRV